MGNVRFTKRGTCVKVYQLTFDPNNDAHKALMEILDKATEQNRANHSKPGAATIILQLLEKGLANGGEYAKHAK